jgi:hypothetical protein
MNPANDQLRTARIQRERQTLEAMIRLYCAAQHGGPLCDACRELLDYAQGRLERCPFRAAKPTCARCPIHCYKPAMRDQVKRVMRFAGPRMLYRHPWLAVRHWLDSRSPQPQR